MFFAKTKYTDVATLPWHIVIISLSLDGFIGPHAKIGPPCISCREEGTSGEAANARNSVRRGAAVSRKGGGGKGGPPHRPPRSSVCKVPSLGAELSGLNGEIEYRTPEKKVNVKSTNMVKERRGPWKVPFKGVCEAVELGAFPRRRWADEPFYLVFLQTLG